MERAVASSWRPAPGVLELVDRTRPDEPQGKGTVLATQRQWRHTRQRHCLSHTKAVGTHTRQRHCLGHTKGSGNTPGKGTVLATKGSGNTRQRQRLLCRTGRRQRRAGLAEWPSCEGTTRHEAKAVSLPSSTTPHEATEQHNRRLPPPEAFPRCQWKAQSTGGVRSALRAGSNMCEAPMCEQLMCEVRLTAAG